MLHLEITPEKLVIITVMKCFGNDIYEVNIYGDYQ